MPTYEYECAKCGHQFELFQKMSDAPVKDCPNCETKGSVKRLIGKGAGLIFKGSGFYITDYKNKPESKSEKKSEAAAAKAETPVAESGAKSETKAEPAKTETKKPEPAPAKID